MKIAERILEAAARSQSSLFENLIATAMAISISTRKLQQLEIIALRRNAMVLKEMHVPTPYKADELDLHAAYEETHPKDKATWGQKFRRAGNIIRSLRSVRQS